MTQPRKAAALISGGLDSLLAAKLMLDQGIHVEGINFFTGFCVEGHTHAIRSKDKHKPKRNNALWVAETLGIKLHIIDVIEPYKEVVLNPSHGYGANLNPCLDCKGFMVGKALEWIQENDFDFIVTGEVIGQRPMSQRRDTMPVIAKESGAGDLLLRPLCARLLPETKPEREGWVDRERLLNLSGRNRKPQIALARQYGFEDYAQPAGGCCFLTDAAYSKKLADLWENRGEKQYDLDDIMLLKVGRHVRPKSNMKLIVARDDGENNFLSGYKKRFTNLYAVSHKGPLVLLDGEADDADLELAARLVARFGQGRDADAVNVSINLKDGNTREMVISPMPVTEIPQEWYV
jgi:tRNA-specific 2-thiouridylase